MRHRGRSFQVFIYLGKIIRVFLYQNDWKVLPMAAVVAGMASLVVRSGMFHSMEKTLLGSLALTCVAIWNGFFNSIQVVCRERSIIKREHRAGMHISAYLAAHMIFQAVLCALQAGITIYVCIFIGIKFPQDGLITNYYGDPEVAAAGAGAVGSSSVGIDWCCVPALAGVSFGVNLTF